MGDGDDLKVSFCDSVNYAVRKPPEEKLPRTVQVHWPSLGTAFDFTDGLIELGHESICGGGIALGIPPKGGPCFRDSLGMELSAWTIHEPVRGSGAAPPTKVPSLLFPCLNPRCGVQSPYPTPPQRLHPLIRPDFQLAGRQAQRALQQADVAPLPKPFCGSCSWNEFYNSRARQHKFKAREVR